MFAKVFANCARSQLYRYRYATLGLRRRMISALRLALPSLFRSVCLGKEITVTLDAEMIEKIGPCVSTLRIEQLDVVLEELIELMQPQVMKTSLPSLLSESIRGH